MGMNTLHDMLEVALRYLLARLMEPSTYRGLILIFGAKTWHALDAASKGEIVMQYAIIAAGLVAVLFPDRPGRSGEPRQ
jgi:hypothetical protein